MRIFGSKVIALNKRPRQNKFEAKGELYLLVVIQMNRKYTGFGNREPER